jgi:hypothetical protein
MKVKMLYTPDDPAMSSWLHQSIFQEMLQRLVWCDSLAQVYTPDSPVMEFKVTPEHLVFTNEFE